jgi:hypothetical protein
MTDGDRELSPAQERAIDMLASGMRLAPVAAELNIGLKTLWTWRHDPRFAAELQARLDAARQAACDQLAAMASEAAGALREVLSSDNDSAKLAAAKAALAIVGIEAPSASVPQVQMLEACPQLTDAEVHGRVRRLVLQEFAGLEPHELAERVRAVLDGEE